MAISKYYTVWIKSMDTLPYFYFKYHTIHVYKGQVSFVGVGCGEFIKTCVWGWVG